MTIDSSKIKTASHKALIALAVSFLAVLIWSGIEPHDRWTWILEVLPAVAAFVILGATRSRFPLTWLAMVGIWLHAVILCVGGHYTYAEVPIGNWLKDAFDLSRNHYDRLGHVAQGFFPAIVGREILLRTSPLVPGKWLAYLTVSVCLAISAFYELLEWWVAISTEKGADAFLGTQGDVWDTQWDMCLALIGAISALMLLSRIHNRALGIDATRLK
jgi:putative membrane protein